MYRYIDIYVRLWVRVCVCLNTSHSTRQRREKSLLIRPVPERPNETLRSKLNPKS